MGLSLIVATSARSENRLDLFTDAAGTQCELVDTGGLQTIYVFLSGTEPATAVVFAAPRPACWQGATWVGDSFPGERARIGNSQGEFFISCAANVQCVTPRVYVCGILFVTTGVSSSCCEMRVTPTIVPPADVPELFYTDCDIGRAPLSSGQKVVINPNSTCHCSQPLATEATTWGRVKSLYR